MSGALSCRWCRQIDRSEALHGNNHGGGMGLNVGHCIAQHLVAEPAPLPAYYFFDHEDQLDMPTEVELTL